MTILALTCYYNPTFKQAKLPATSKGNLLKHNKLTTQLIIFLASGAYTGFSPIASGTVGSLAGIAIYLFFPHKDLALYLLLTLLFSIAGCWISQQAEIIFDKKDSGKIVIDEIAGFFIAMFALPATWKWIAAGFFIFRFFDIIKPPPAAQCENIPGGAGVMADDLMAGIYTNIVLQTIYFFFR